MPEEAGIVWKNGESLEGLMKHVEDAYEEAGKHAAKELGGSIEDRTKENTPVAKPTEGSTDVPGALRASIKQTPILRLDWGWEGKIYTTVEYAPYVEYGTGLWGPSHAKYKIEPKTPDGVLAFFARAKTPEGKPLLSGEGDPVEGAMVFARFVMHPGSPGQHMFQFGAVAGEAQIEIIGREAIELMKARIEAYK